MNPREPDTRPVVDSGTPNPAGDTAETATNGTPAAAGGTPPSPGPGAAGGTAGPTGPAAPEGPAGQPPAARDVAARRWRRVRGPLAAALVVIVVGIILAALQPSTQQGYLDPDSPAKDGSQALVRISGQRGTPIQVAHTAAEAAGRLRGAQNALLVVVRSERLVGGDLATLKSAPGDRLLVEPTASTLRELAPGVRPAGRAKRDKPAPGCALRAATLAGSAEVSGRIYQAPPGATKCYPDEGLPGLVRTNQPGRVVTVLGSGTPLTNRRLADAGNAALGMNLLGGRTNVIWLLPDVPAPGSGGDKSPAELLPAGVRLAVTQLAVAVILAAFWRSRRLGPVVTEPLPVVVRSAEAVEGRARLYRARRARDRAADALRAGCLDRLMPLLGLSRSVIQQSTAGDTGRQIEVVSAIAARTGTDADTIGRALYGPFPEEDAELVRLADFLDELEGRVRMS